MRRREAEAKQAKGVNERMEMGSLTWLRADYHLPATYSCRVPMSSITSALALPAPGPATVRLAMIRTGLEIFRADYMESALFPHIRAMPVHIRPPERVALSSQVLRAYKAEDDVRVSEAPIVREMAHANGFLSIYLHIPSHLQEPFRHILSMIGYWGQTSSLAWCTEIGTEIPVVQECVQAVQRLSGRLPLGSFFSCILSEFRTESVTWKEIMPLVGGRNTNPLRLDVYVWPLVLTAQQESGKLFVRTRFKEVG